jgi:hypothetical protein
MRFRWRHHRHDCSCVRRGTGFSRDQKNHSIHQYPLEYFGRGFFSDRQLCDLLWLVTLRLPIQYGREWISTRDSYFLGFQVR